jgi:hypothetical protein
MMCIKLAFEQLPRDELMVHRHTDDIHESISQIKAMKKQETKYRCHDYKSYTRSVIDEDCRKKMVDWCFRVIDYFKLSRRSVSVAMPCVDRFLCTPDGKLYLRDKSLYQLACITSLHVAVKVHETVEIDISSLVRLCRGVYTEMQIIKTEEVLLKSLKWTVHPPTLKDFVQHFVAMLRGVHTSIQQALLNLACYQADMALYEYRVGVLSSPSVIALASFASALSFLPEVESKSRSATFQLLQKTTNCLTQLDNIEQVMEIMQAQLDDVNTGTATSSNSKNFSNCHRHSLARKSPCDSRAKTRQARSRSQRDSPDNVMHRR